MNEEKKVDGLVKSQIRKILNASGEDWLGFIVLTFIAALVFIVVNLCTRDHMVRCYYLKTVSTQSGLAYRELLPCICMKPSYILRH